MFKSLSKYMQYRKTIRELEQLSDRQLTDIGITRFDIPYIANKKLR